MFLTASEHRELGGKKADTTNKSYRPLPFDACALSLQPFEVRPSIHVAPRPSNHSIARSADRGYDAKPLASQNLTARQQKQTPVCTPEGVLFDILNLFPYVQKASACRMEGDKDSLD